MTQNVYWSSCKQLFTFVYSELNIYFVGAFSKNNVVSNFKYIHPVGTDFAHGRRTDMQIFIRNLRPLLQFCQRASKERISMQSVG